MKEFIKQILAKLLCCHEWELLRQIDKFENSTSKRPYKTTYIYYCTKCGKINKIEIE